MNIFKRFSNIWRLGELEQGKEMEKISSWRTDYLKKIYPPDEIQLNKMAKIIKMNDKVSDFLKED